MAEEYYYKKRNANRPADYHKEVAMASYGKDLTTSLMPIIDELYVRWGFKGSLATMSCHRGYGGEVWYKGKVIISYQFPDTNLWALSDVNDQAIYIYKQFQMMLADAILIRAEKEGRV